MKKIIFGVALIFFTFHYSLFTCAAQELSKQVEVTREYVPQVEQADKLPVEPTPLSTEQMSLSSPYRINSVARPTPFTPQKLTPVTIEGQEDNPEKIYLRVGAGLPAQTTADIYYTPKMPRGSTLGFFGNHRGVFKSYRNDLKIPASADEWLAGGGVFGSHEINRFILQGDVTFDHRAYTLYGVSPVNVRPFFEIADEDVVRTHFAINTETKNRLAWSGLRGNLSFGDTFTDLRYLNFRVTLGLGFTPQPKQADFDLGVRLSRLWGRLNGTRHGIDANVWERAATVKNGGTTFTLGVEPRYVLERGLLRLSAGVDVFFMENRAWAQSSAVFRGPVFDVRAVFADGKVEPFAFYKTTIVDGSEAALSRVNPYILGTAPTGVSSDLRVGLQGKKPGRFRYKVSGGVSFLDNHHIMVARQDISVGRQGASTDWDVFYQPVRFTATGVAGKIYTAGFDLGLEGLGKFAFDLYGNWREMTLDGVPEIVADVPMFDAGLGVTYRRTDRLTFRAGLDWTGRRKYNVFYNLDHEAVRVTQERAAGVMKAALDFSASAELKVVDGFWLWAEGNNLLGQHLSPYPYYKGLGINLLVGVKATF